MLEATIDGGGAFGQAFNALLQLQRICQNRFDFEVFTTVRANLPALSRLGLKGEHVEITLRDRFVSRASLNPLWHSMQSRKEWLGPLEVKVIEHGGDIVYFLGQSANSGMLQRTNCIVTLYDLCHRDTPEFPEARAKGQFLSRERYLHANMLSALAIITESEELSDSFVKRYGADRERCIALPVSPSPFISATNGATDTEPQRKFSLPDGYYFYPAQFWSHKNHVRIVEAIALLRSWGIEATVAFAGGDKGNRSHVEDVARKLGVTQNVRFLGFVSADDMNALYANAAALVMPTYFGPTNMPPLEAWSAGTPVIYSKHLSDHSGDAALLVNPDDAGELAGAMERVKDQTTRARLVAAGKSRLAEIEGIRARNEKALIGLLEQFAERRKCWA